MARNSPPGKHRLLRSDRRIALRGAGGVAAGAAGILVPVLLLSGGVTTAGPESTVVAEHGGRVVTSPAVPQFASSEVATTTAEQPQAPVSTAGTSIAAPVHTTTSVKPQANDRNDVPDPCAEPTTTAVEGSPTTAGGSPPPLTTAAVAPPVVDDPGTSGCPTAGTVAVTTSDVSPTRVSPTSEHVDSSSAFG